MYDTTLGESCHVFGNEGLMHSRKNEKKIIVLI